MYYINCMLYDYKIFKYVLVNFHAFVILNPTTLKKNLNIKTNVLTINVNHNEIVMIIIIIVINNIIYREA